MTTKVDERVAERAVELWRARIEEPPLRDGFTDEEACAIAGIDLATLAELVPRLQAWPSPVWRDDMEDYDLRWTVVDLTRLILGIELCNRGTPALVVACAYRDFPYDEEWVHGLAEEPTRATAYPLALELGTRWVTESGLVYRCLWSEDELARLDEDLRTARAADDADARVCIARGEAVAYREGEAALRVLRAAEAWDQRVLRPSPFGVI
jgi:hypothetical protein